MTDTNTDTTDVEPYDNETTLSPDTDGVADPEITESNFSLRHPEREQYLERTGAEDLGAAPLVAVTAATANTNGFVTYIPESVEYSTSHRNGTSGYAPLPSEQYLHIYITDAIDAGNWTHFNLHGATKTWKLDSQFDHQLRDGEFYIKTSQSDMAHEPLRSQHHL